MTNEQIIIYRTTDGQTAIDVTVTEENIWLTQAQMQELFNQTKQNISLHINNIFKEGELDVNSVVKESLTTAADGKKYKTKYYALDLIKAIGRYQALFQMNKPIITACNKAPALRLAGLSILRPLFCPAPAGQRF